MLAVSGTLYRLRVNVLRDLETLLASWRLSHNLASWCESKKKIPDTQFGFSSHRNTL